MKSPLDLVHYHTVLLKFLGLFKIDSGSKVLKFLMKMHTYFYMILIIDIGFLLFGLTIFLESIQIKEKLLIIFVSFAFSNALFKSLQFYAKRQSFRHFWSKLKHPDFMPMDNVEAQLLEKPEFFIRKMINVYFWLGAVNLLMAVMAPILEWKRRLPSPLYLPFGFGHTTAGFYFIYVYECLCGFYAGGLNIGVNMFMFDVFVSLTFVLSLLSLRVSRLGHPNGIQKYFTDISYAKLSYYQEFCQLVKFHLKIDGLVRELNALVNDMLFIQIIQAVLVFANALYLLIGYELTFGEFIQPLFWLMAFLAEMAIFCFFGNNIAHEFEGVHHSIYSSNFVTFDQKSKEALLKMMAITGAREMKISAVGFVRFELSLETLLRILKTTYSTVMLMQSM